MPTNPNQLDHLLRTPGETLNVELKAWIDPATPEGQAKIAKGCLALRNRNGGYLVIGVDDKTLAVQPCPAGLDAGALFHGDRIQDLISRYASEPFPVEVVFVPSPAGVHPVVAVPSGVRAPVAVMQSLAGAKKELLRVGDVPFRTLNANGRVSTASARPEDWRELVGICFDNREADVAGFLRRHLSALTPEVFKTLMSAAEPPVAASERAEALLDACRPRFEAAAATVDVRVKPAWGGSEVGLVIDPPLSDEVADRAFLNRIYAANPNYGGGFWLDLRGAPGAKIAVKDGAWETFAAMDGWVDLLDYSRFEPDGRFYARRPHMDDALADARKAQPQRIIDPAAVVADVGEALAVGIAIAQACGVPGDATLAFAWRWTGLENRRLATFSPMELGALLVGQYVCIDPEVRSISTVPAGTSPLAVAPFAHAATRPLFAAFAGFSVSAPSVERIVTARLQRRPG